VVLDEAQALKNPEQPDRRAPPALPAPQSGVTGTPRSENELEELWSLLHFPTAGVGREPRVRGVQAAPSPRGNRGARPPCASACFLLLRGMKKDARHRAAHEHDAVAAPRARAKAKARGLHAVSAADAEGKSAGVDRPGATGAVDRQGGRDAGAGGVDAPAQGGVHPALRAGPEGRRTSSRRALRGAASRRWDRAARVTRAGLLAGTSCGPIEPALARAELRSAPTAALAIGRVWWRASRRRRRRPAAGDVVALKARSAASTHRADHVFLCDPWWKPAVEAQAARPTPHASARKSRCSSNDWSQTDTGRTDLARRTAAA